MATAITHVDFWEHEAIGLCTVDNSVHSPLFGFLPAFRDALSGETHLSTNADGSLSLIHQLERLPEEWVLRRDEQDRVVELKHSIVAGFVRDGRFFTYTELNGYHLDA